MSKRGWGRVVQTTSAAGSKGFPIGLSIYGAAKAAIEGAMRNIAVEEAKSGVTLNSITPGLLSNNAGRPGMDGVGAASTIGTLASVPLGRFTEPTEVAAAVVWLTSEPGGVVTGQTIHINGGSLHGR
jgi:3-oxoacyl-[acyl-carrier protein] reductase